MAVSSMSVFWIELLVLIGCTAAEQADENDEEHQWSLNDDTAFTILGVCIGICGVTILFDVVYLIQTIRLYKIYNTPNKDLLRLLEETADLIDAKNLQDRIRQVLSMRPREASLGESSDPRDQLKIDEFLKGIKDCSLGQQTETMQGARDNGQLPIRKDNRLKLLGRPSTNLHISELADLYSNPVFLSAAPLPSQFADHWEAIWQAKIGVVVWVGRLVTNESRMDAYIALKEGEEVKFGNFSIKTIESGDLLYKYALYYVRVQHGVLTRDLVFVHAYEWLQDSVSWALERDVELLQCIKEEHCRRMRRAGLRGLMFQCKFGTAGSASLMAAYVGFQFWMRDGKVNLYGILKYIRRMRPMAFEQTGDPNHTFFIQVQVAYVAMYGVAKLCETKKVPRFDGWIKELLTKN